MAKEKPRSPSASPAFRLQLAAVRSSVSGGHARPAPDTGGGLYTGERREGQPLLSGSIATSRAASRHNSAGVRREPSSSKMRTSFRLRPSSTRTCSRAALALSGRSTTSLTPTLEVTVNFMAVRASPSRSKTKTPRGSRRGSVVTGLTLGQISGGCIVNFLLLQGHAGLARVPLEVAIAMTHRQHHNSGD